MESGNVELVERLYAAFSTGDTETLLSLLDPSVTWELVGPAEIPYFGCYEGVDGVERFLSTLAAHCVVDSFEVDQVVATSDGAVAQGRERGSFVGHPQPYEMRWCHVFEIRNGAITSFVDHLDTAPMIAAFRS